MSEYRWDLHHRKIGNEGKARCTQTSPDGDQCEFIVHDAHAHSAQDGSRQWVDRDWPGFDDATEEGLVGPW